MKNNLFAALLLGATTGCSDKDKDIKDLTPKIKVENETALTQTVDANQTSGTSGVT